MSIDPRLRKAILDAVRGKDSPWPIDQHYPLSGTFQERFKGGDDQILLWAIALAAEDGKSAPDWATAALMERLLQVSVAAKDWDGAFGSPRSKRGGGAPGANERKIAHRAAHMFECFDIVEERRAKGDSVTGILFEDIGDKLGFSGSTVSDYYYAVKNWRAE